MATYRIKKEENFVQIHKTMIMDERLSFKAKGILMYLLSRPNDWQVYETEITKHTKDGRDSVRSGIKELIKNGYIIRKGSRDENGRFKGYDYEVYEVPHRVGKSDNGNSEVGQANTTNNEYTKNNKTNNYNKGEERVTSLSHREISLTVREREVIEHYMMRYREYRGKTHPRLKSHQWDHVLENMFYVDDFDLSEDDLIDMIDKHFVTEYENCDYNILHFMSDGVRVNRMYEVAY